MRSSLILDSRVMLEAPGAGGALGDVLGLDMNRNIVRIKIKLDNWKGDK